MVSNTQATSGIGAKLMLNSKKLGAILLISCTTIGGGILALPTNTYAAGFYPTAMNFVVCWIFMTLGALYLLEVALWQSKRTNIISMSGSTLGLPGQVISWTAYLLLLYALLSAYLTAATGMLNVVTNDFFSNYLTVPFLAFGIGFFIFLGTRATDMANKILSIALTVIYLLLMSMILPKIDLSVIGVGDLKTLPATVPLLVTSFGFAIVIPSLCDYLSNDQKSLSSVIIIGSIIPLIVYLFWEFGVIGLLSIPGENGLEELSKQHADGTQVASAIQNLLQKNYVTIISHGFAACAILTSFLGVALSLFHFLADGLKYNMKGLYGIKLFFMTFLPPIIAVLFYPAGFDSILKFGGIFVAILLGLLPCLMVWSGRYKRQKSGNFKVPGGKTLIIFTSVFFIYTILQEIYNLAN